jgi:hypothetical protein
MAVRNTFVDGFWSASNTGLASFITNYDLALYGTNFQSFLPHSAGDSIRVCVWNTTYNKWYTKGVHVDATGSTAYRTGIDTLPSKFCFGSAKNCTPPSTSTITGVADVCTSQTGTVYSVTNTTGSTYNWSFDNAGGTITSVDPNANSITVTWGVTGQTDVVRVREQNNCTLGAAVTYNVNVHSLAPTAITGDLKVPVSQTGVIYTAQMTDYTNYTFNWTVIGGSIVADGFPNDKTITVNWNSTPGDGTVSATATYSGCAVSSSTSATVLKYNIIESVDNGDWDDVGFSFFGITIGNTWNCQCVPAATDNVKINNGNTVYVANPNIIIDNVTIDAAGILDVANNNNFQVTGDFIVDGSFIGTQGIELSGTDSYIGGVGTISNTGGINITTGNKNVKPAASLTISGSDVTISSNLSVLNNGSVTISGNNLVGTDATSKWTNEANSHLTIDGSLLTLGTLTASASNNTVDYNSVVARSVKTPFSSTYYNLELTGASTKSQLADLILGGNLTINSGTLDGGGFNMNIGGDWSNLGVYTESTGTVTFDGTVNQSITNSVGETFYNLIVNKSATAITLIDNISVTNALTMTSGNIDALTNVKTLNLGTSVEGTLNHISGTIIGNFNRYITATGAKLFQVGTASTYHPITFNFNDNPTDGSLLVSFNATDPGLFGTTFPFADAPVNVTDYFNDGYWSATSTGLASTNYDMQLIATGFDDVGTFLINSATRLLKRTTGTWGVEGSHVNAVGSEIYRNAMTLATGNYTFGLGDTDCATFASQAITGGTDVCASETGVAYSVTNTPGNSYLWSIAKGTLFSGQGTSNITVDWQATADVLAYVRVVESSACYDAPQSESEVTIHSLPTSAISGATMVFDNSANWNYSVSARAGYTYTWSILAGNGTIVADLDATDNTITVDWGNPSAATIQVIGTKTGCSAATAVTLAVDVFSSYFTIADGNWTTGATWQGGIPPTTLQNAKILNNVTITSNTDIVNFYIGTGASLTQTGGVNLTITGNYYNDGVHDAANGNIILNAVSTGLVLNGSGTINNVGDVQINNQNFTISNSANLIINNTPTGQLSIGNGLYLNNEGILSVSNNIVGIASTSTLNNKTNATLNVGGNLLTTGVLIASANGNTVNYNGSGAQNIKQPQSNTYYNLSSNTGGTKTLTGSLTCYGNLSILNASTLDVSASNYNIIIYGNWLNTSTGAFNEQLGKVSLKGTGAQAITSTLGETFYNLEIIQNLNQITTLNNDITISNNLLLSRGFINGNLKLVRILDNATTSGGNAISFVDGMVRKIGNDAFIFPTGDGNVWARVGISTPATITSEFTAQYFYSPYSNLTLSAVPEILNRVSAIEYWNLDRTVGTDNVSTSLYWEDSTRSGIGAPAFAADLRVAHWNGSAWESVGQTAVTSGVAGSLTSNIMTAFSPLALASVGTGNPLPVEMLYFMGTTNPTGIELTWATASETNNDYFEIQRSADAKNFYPIDVVYGAGNSMLELNYTYHDNNPLFGINYYRLKQVDYDGAFEIHKTISVDFSNNSMLQNEPDINVYPNPFKSGNLILDLTKLTPNLSIKIVISDTGGKTIYKAALIIPEDQQVNLIPIAIDKLNKGVYLVNIIIQ